MERYITRRYVAVCWTEAVRLANIDDTPLDGIRCHENVELLHRTEWWAWWSDERLTTAIGLPENLQVEALSADAAELIFDVWMGGLVAPQCGWATLAQVKRIVGCERMHPPNVLNAPACSSWERLIVLFKNEIQHVMYRYCYRDEAGYTCDLMSDYPT